MYVRVAIGLFLAGTLFGVTARSQPLIKELPVFSPDGSELLVEGPVSATIGRIDSTGRRFLDKGTLLYATVNGVYYRPADRDEVVACPAAKGTATSVYAEVPVEGGKSRPFICELDPAKKKFVLQVQPLPKRTFTLEPLPISGAKELNYYLFHALERLHLRSENALTKKNAKLIEHYAGRATAIEAYIQAEKLDPEMGRIYAGLPEYLAGQIKASTEIDEAITAAIRKNSDLAVRARTAVARHQAESTAGLLNAFIGAIPSVEYEYSPFGGLRVVERYDSAGIMSGFSTMAQAQMKYQHEMGRLAAAREVLDLSTSERCKKLQAEIQTAAAERTIAIRKVGSERFHFPAENPINNLAEVRGNAAKAKKPEQILEFLKHRLEQNKGDSPRDDPFALIDLYVEQAMLTPNLGKNSATLLALAEKAATAARLVPPGDIFDFDRIEVLQSAAFIACLAATAETHNGTWGRAYNPRAGFAVSLLASLGTIERFDPTGESRERQAIAMMLAGRGTEALKTMLSVYELRKESVTYQLNLARLYSVRTAQEDANAKADLEAGLNAIEQAVKLGFRNFVKLETEKDFDFLRLSPRYRIITRLDVLYQVDWGFQGGTMTLANRTAVPLTNVSVTVAVLVNGKRVGNSIVLPFKGKASLEAGAAVRLPSMLPRVGLSNYELEVMLTCDQQKKPAKLDRK